MDQPHSMEPYYSLSNSKSQFSFGERPDLQEPDIITEDGVDVRALIKPGGSHQTTHSRSAPGTDIFSCFRWWLPEIFASVLSVACLLFLILLVRSYHGQTLQELNLPYSLTLNGLVALLSEVIRAALMVPIGSAMSQEVWLWLSEARKQSTRRGQLRDLEISDAASRGAWGSLLFLFKTRRRWLAYVGALITIISLAFGTFTQQLLGFKSFQVNTAALEPGNIPRSEVWVEYTGNPAEAAMSVPLTLKAATYTGILTADIQPVTASCPTGNCTWPLTPSMAICGACTKSLFTTSCNDSICAYTMPSGTIANLANFTELSEGMGFQVMPSPGHVYDRSASDMLYVANFDVFGAPDGSFATGPVISPSNAVSWECAMWMCIQAFATQMVDLNQTQPVVRNFSQVVNSTLPGGFSGNDNFSFVDLPIAMNPRSGANYLVGIMASLAIEGYLEPIFNGTIFLNLESQTFSSDYIQAIWNASSDLDGWIKNLASSMTNVIRTETPQPNDFYNGKGYQLGVQVHWPWIALPVVLVALSLITLIVTMIRTARSPVRAWKGSPLALLFMEVDQDIRRRVSGQMNTYNGIDSFVSKSKVVLRSDGDGSWIFKGTQ